MRQQVAIVVHISDEVNTADNAGGVAELVETIEQGLKDEGMDSEVYTAADDHRPPPRIELNVVYWSERSTTARNLGIAGAVLLPLGIVSAPLDIASVTVGPSNRMVVDCAVFLGASAQPLFSRRIDAGPGLGTDEAAAGGRAASEILHRIFKSSLAEASAPLATGPPGVGRQPNK